MSKWETPARIAALAVIVAVLAATIGGWIGYQTAQTPQTINVTVHLDGPLVVAPAPAR